MYVDWDPPQLSPVVYITPTYASSMQEFMVQECNKNYKSP